MTDFYCGESVVKSILLQLYIIYIMNDPNRQVLYCTNENFNEDGDDYHQMNTTHAAAQRNTFDTFTWYKFHW